MVKATDFSLIPLSSFQVYHSEGEECQEVWLAGGDRKTTMVSWIQPLNSDPENSIQVRFKVKYENIVD